MLRRFRQVILLVRVCRIIWKAIFNKSFFWISPALAKTKKKTEPNFLGVYLVYSLQTIGQNKTMKMTFFRNTRNNLLLAGAFALLASCSSDNKNPREDYPAGDAGTSEAIVGDSSNLNEPRPAPIGDTAENASQANQLGEPNVENVDSAARGLK
ncbi:hypothetical protein HUW51_04465 [Adhaeribacter swui]|uniref:Lipoprotein n=1 Tax=Adhaeribacter swui TaxID=2086471 RepID=A0A7G7G4D1_9BACT|nr:hypothetical protein [Adhaeribacter swui]QNF32015.1 hypothetical protein HUW51_04465 [Adhaeribacter swui]